MEALSGEELNALVAFGREQLGVEFKGPGPRTDRQLLAKVIRAVLGMANRQDGGRVIIGINEDAEHKPVLTGLTDEHIRTWNYDDFANSVAEYADPYVGFDLDIASHADKACIVITVHEFEDIPILCKREYSNTTDKVVLKKGACYVRSRRKPETVEVSSHVDMRELLDLAITKGVRRFVSRARQAAIGPWTGPTDSERYDAEIGDDFK